MNETNATDTDHVVGEDDTDDAIVLPWWQNPLNFVALGLAMLILGVGIGYFVGHRNASESYNDADVGFLQDMRYHHEQAVDMAFYYLTAVDEPLPRLELYAKEILYAQQLEVGLMIELLRDFGESEVNDTGVAMAWMGTPVPIDDMDGLATRDELNEFATADGDDASIAFATLMLDHHLGGIHMAENVRDSGRNADVRLLAESMIRGQTAEVTEITAVLQELTS